MWPQWGHVQVRRARQFNAQRYTRTAAPEGYDPNLLETLRAEEAYEAAAPMRQAQAVVDGLRNEIAEVNAELLWWRDTPFNQMVWEDAPVDVLTDYEMRPRDQQPLALEFRELWDAAYSEFIRMVDAKGLVFSSSPETGERVRKLAAFVRVLFHKRHIALTAGNFFLAFRKLWSLGVITDKDVSGFTETEAIPSQYDVPNPLPVQPQAPKQSIAAQIESADANEALAIVNAQWGSAVAARYREFSDFMQREYKVDVLQPRIVEYCGEWAMRTNANLLSYADLDRFRKVLDFQQLLGPRGRLLQSDERFALSIEDVPLANADFETRRDVITRLKAKGEGR